MSDTADMELTKAKEKVWNRFFARAAGSWRCHMHSFQDVKGGICASCSRFAFAEALEGVHLRHMGMDVVPEPVPMPESPKHPELMFKISLMAAQIRAGYIAAKAVPATYDAVGEAVMLAREVNRRFRADTDRLD